MGLGQDLRVARALGQLQRPAGESGGLFGFVLAVGEQAPVGVEPREFGFAFLLSEIFRADS